MNRSILLVLIILTLSTSSKGQKFFNPELVLGFNGIHVQGQNNLFWTNHNGTIWGGGGVSYGLGVASPKNKKLVVQLELRYIRKGSIYEFINEYGQRDFENLRLRYVEIPLLFGHNFGKKNKKDILLSSGPAYGRLIYNKLLYNPVTERPDNPWMAEFKKNDLSWLTEINASLNKNKNIYGSFRVSYSLISVYNALKLYNLVYGLNFSWFLYSN